uniref:OTU domain-containing protein n=1 Tax=Rhabditophanes sp. KR3021 TaxID=114890 RepID=A0AC35TS46_9BILA
MASITLSKRFQALFNIPYVVDEIASFSDGESSSDSDKSFGTNICSGFEDYICSSPNNEGNTDDGMKNGKEVTSYPQNNNITMPGIVTRISCDSVDMSNEELPDNLLDDSDAIELKDDLSVEIVVDSNAPNQSSSSNNEGNTDDGMKNGKEVTSYPQNNNITMPGIVTRISCDSVDMSNEELPDNLLDDSDAIELKDDLSVEIVVDSNAPNQSRYTEENSYDCGMYADDKLVLNPNPFP